MMTVIEKDYPEYFEEAKVGDIFKYRKRIYIKVKNSKDSFGKFNAICLTDGDSAFFIDGNPIHFCATAKLTL